RASLLLKHPPHSETSPLSLHDALPISLSGHNGKNNVDNYRHQRNQGVPDRKRESKNRRYHQDFKQSRNNIEHQKAHQKTDAVSRSEEHTSELQSRENLVCRLLLEKKK